MYARGLTVGSIVQVSVYWARYCWYPDLLLFTFEVPPYFGISKQYDAFPDYIHNNCTSSPLLKSPTQSIIDLKRVYFIYQNSYRKMPAFISPLFPMPNQIISIIKPIPPWQRGGLSPPACHWQSPSQSCGSSRTQRRSRLQVRWWLWQSAPWGRCKLLSHLNAESQLHHTKPLAFPRASLFWGRGVEGGVECGVMG